MRTCKGIEGHVRGDVDRAVGNRTARSTHRESLQCSAIPHPGYPIDMRVGVVDSYSAADFNAASEGGPHALARDAHFPTCTGPGSRPPGVEPGPDLRGLDGAEQGCSRRIIKSRTEILRTRRRIDLHEAR